MHSRATSCKEMRCRDDKTSSPRLQFRNVCEYQGRSQYCSQVSKLQPSWRALPHAGVPHGQGAPTPLTAGNSVVPAALGVLSSFSVKCYPEASAFQGRGPRVTLVLLQMLFFRLNQAVSITTSATDMGAEQSKDYGIWPRALLYALLWVI